MVELMTILPIGASSDRFFAGRITIMSALPNYVAVLIMKEEIIVMPHVSPLPLHSDNKRRGGVQLPSHNSMFAFRIAKSIASCVKNLVSLGPRAPKLLLVINMWLKKAKCPFPSLDPSDAFHMSSYGN
eukprot:8542034-Karenia_brevis.AAC.1